VSFFFSYLLGLQSNAFCVASEPLPRGEQAVCKRKEKSAKMCAVFWGKPSGGTEKLSADLIYFY